MVRRIVIIVLICAVVVLILMWLLSGGWGAVSRFVSTIPNPIDVITGHASSTYSIKFPWQIALPRGSDISGLTAQGNAESGNVGGQAEVSSYDQTQAQDAQNFGTPSASRGVVVLSAAAADESDPRLEYVELTSRSSQSISLRGWSLQSALSGVRVFLPAAANPFKLGVVNALQVITLGSGESATVVSGPSPVGVSFKESRCTGYLAQLQAFTPSLQNACPASSDIAPLTAENIQHYGSDCLDFVRSLPSCTFPTSLPSTLTPGCRAFIQNAFSYQGCVDRLSGSASFDLSSWRLYLNSGSEFWDNRHDIIRLLDAQGLTVDAVSY